MVGSDKRAALKVGTPERAALDRRRRTRNLALLAALVAFMVLVYVISIVRMSEGAFR